MRRKGGEDGGFHSFMSLLSAVETENQREVFAQKTVVSVFSPHPMGS